MNDVFYEATGKALYENQHCLQAILENLNEGLVIADQYGNLIHWNQAALDMLGFSCLDEVLNPLADFTGLFELATLEGRVLSLQEWPLARLLQGESSCQLELYTRRRHSDWERIFRYSGSRIRIAGNQMRLLPVSGCSAKANRCWNCTPVPVCILISTGLMRGCRSAVTKSA
jgi:PAS domain-containing protein